MQLQGCLQATRTQQGVLILLRLGAGYYSPTFRGFFFRYFRAPLKETSKREGKAETGFKIQISIIRAAAYSSRNVHPNTALVCQER